jgi:nitrogen fixation/metabolism regulation signal transduction histidine kinase
MRALPAIALAALLTTPIASAQSNAAQVEGFLRRGVALRQQGNDEGALERAFIQLKTFYADTRWAGGGGRGGGGGGRL